MGYDMFYADERGGSMEERYFRFNIFGMGRAREAMIEAGMVCEAPMPEIGTPDWEITHLGECPGIPLYKFCSNDGWLVTPAEIAAALAAAKRYGRVPPAFADEPSYWRDWLRYLRRAADHGGVRVY